MRAVGSEERGGWRGGVDENVVFLEFLDVSLNLVHLGLQHFLAALLADGVEFAVMRLLLVVAHEDLPFLLQGTDQLLTLLFGHQHSLAVEVVLLIDLHLAYKVVLVLDLLLDLGHVLRDFTVGPLLEHVLFRASREFGS
jgi:hypothetical protein